VRWWRHKERARDLERELESDLELEAAEQREKGLSSAEASYAARRAFGNATYVKEEVRGMWGWTWFERLAQDLRYAARILLKSPVFTAVAVLSLALGIGANTAIFTLIDALMLRSLPVAEPAQLVQIDKFYDNQPGGFSYPLYQQLRDRNQVFRGVLTASRTPLRLTDEPESEGAKGQYVSGNFFQVLGVRVAWPHPRTGRRSPLAGGGNPVAVIGYGLWQRRFGGDPAAVGKTLPVEGRLFTVVGVLPPGFYGIQVGEALDFAIPIAGEARIRPQSWLGVYDFNWLSVVARLQPGVSRTRARADLAVIFHQVLQAHSGSIADAHERELALSQGLEVTPAANGLSAPRDEFSHPLAILMGVVALVLSPGEA
jgi:hypothetical protein